MEKDKKTLNFDYRGLLNYKRHNHISFSEYVDRFLENPDEYLYTSSRLISEAIKFFGYKIVIRSGEPVLQYNVFRDIFSNGVNAVYGQEFCIKTVVDVIESISKESGPNRGIVLVGPPASGKTNIVDLISLALEQYTKEKKIKLYSFFYRFEDENDPERVIEISSSFQHNPILFFTTLLQDANKGIIKPRRELFHEINRVRSTKDKVYIPTYYQNASLDKKNLDIIEALVRHPRNRNKTLFDVLEKYVRVEEIEFSHAQGVGIANIDDMQRLKVNSVPLKTSIPSLEIISQHLPLNLIYQYEGALISSNRGLLHIHDAFGSHNNHTENKPLLILLGSGKISLESSQAAIDTCVLVTTNIEEMNHFENELTSSKMLDRIEKIAVNYLIDAGSEMEILKRDMSNIKEKFDVDPNLFRIASYYSVLTRLLPTQRVDFPKDWPIEKINLYRSITPEQKLFIFSCPPANPLETIQNLPINHPFRREALRHNIDIHKERDMLKMMEKPNLEMTLESSGVFSSEQLSLIDDDFKRLLWNEHDSKEGMHGISIRQLQNIMRDTIANSDGRKILTATFIEQLKKVMIEGSQLHHWLKMDQRFLKSKPEIQERNVGDFLIAENIGNFGDFKGLVLVAEAIYHYLIKNQIITATVDRDPNKIESDLRRYIQFVLLAEAAENKSFSHLMIPRYTFVDPNTGEKVDKPDIDFMKSIEKILFPYEDALMMRRATAQKYFEKVANNLIKLEEGKTIINSRKDYFLDSFEKEYNLLLTHRRSNEEIDGSKLADAFYLKKGDPKRYSEFELPTRDFVSRILFNLNHRYGYSQSLALEIVIYALDLNIVNLSDVLN